MSSHAHFRTSLHNKQSFDPLWKTLRLTYFYLAASLLLILKKPQSEANTDNIPAEKYTQSVFPVEPKVVTPNTDGTGVGVADKLSDVVVVVVDEPPIKGVVEGLGVSVTEGPGVGFGVLDGILVGVGVILGVLVGVTDGTVQFVTQKTLCLESFPCEPSALMVNLM